MISDMIPFMGLRYKAEEEVYHLIDKHIRPLPKKNDGSFDTSSKEFIDNDVDALRHAYVSGVFTMKYGEIVADTLGYIREFISLNSPGGDLEQKDKAYNMDLWNNSIGRKYGKKSKTREELFNKLLKALKNGELIIDLKDPRKYSEKPNSEKAKLKDRVIVLKESESGENTLFLDTRKLLIFSRENFVAKIKNGEYGKDYEVRIIKGKEIPTSKRDGHSNLG